MGRTSEVSPVRPAPIPNRLLPTSRLALHEWRVVRERDATLLVSPHARRFLQVDEDGVAAMHALADAPDLADAERLLQRRTGQTYDLVTFAQSLIARGYVRSIDGVELPSRAPKAPKLLARVPPARLLWLQSPLVPLAVLALGASWAVAMARDPTLVPRFAHIAAASRPLWSLLAAVGGLLAVGMLHEMGHYFVARSYGIPVGLGATRRLYFLVLVTDVTAAWALPRRARLRIFLAGIAVNVALASVLTLALAADPASAAAPWLRLLVVLNCFPLVFQLLFFARTDLYYVLALATGDRNLAADARAYLKLRARRVWLRVTRAPWQRCRACSARTYGKEDHCLRCGAPRKQTGAPSEVDMRAGRRLLAVGLVFVAGQVVAWTYAALIGVRVQARLLLVGVAMARQGAGALDLLEGVLVALLALLQLGALLWFVAGGAAMAGMQAWKGGKRA